MEHNGATNPVVVGRRSSFGHATLVDVATMNFFPTSSHRVIKTKAFACSTLLPCPTGFEAAMGCICTVLVIVKVISDGPRIHLFFYS